MGKPWRAFRFSAGATGLRVERRAGSVKRYLVQTWGIANENLISIGYGKSKLKDPDDPRSAINRRVQVLNVAAPVNSDVSNREAKPEPH